MRSKLWGLLPLLVLAATIVLTVTACGGNHPEGRAALPSPPSPAAERGALALPLNTSEPSADESALEEIEAEARKLLADELNEDEGDFKLNSSEKVGWSDASLGCPQEGYFYAQVITPGYKLVFNLEDMPYTVHTNTDGSLMVVCRDGQ
ncbi:MAG: hypothetical protein F4W95_07330 [Chloroflexi bacterium]|nr:hypothetical protein [Chloroflexota bacterium]MYD48283.1 hypothetical protein [Chloroflexota bacterium]